MASSLAKGPGKINEDEEHWEWPKIILSKMTEERL